MHQYYGFILITYINKTWPTSAIYKNLLNEASIDVLSPAWNREKKVSPQHHSSFTSPKEETMLQI